jgi:hypothetical protein
MSENLLVYFTLALSTALKTTLALKRKSVFWLIDILLNAVAPCYPIELSTFELLMSK